MSINDARKQSLYFPEEMLVEIEPQASGWIARSLGWCSLCDLADMKRSDAASRGRRRASRSARPRARGKQ